MDWLLEQQGCIEQSLAQKHLSEGTLVLYDVSSTYFEGETCPLAQFGYNRDGKKGKLQIIFGLLRTYALKRNLVVLSVVREAESLILPLQI